MEHKTYRRGSALAGAAVFGLATTALMAPSAYANTDADPAQEAIGTATVQVEQVDQVDQVEQVEQVEPGLALGAVADAETAVTEPVGEEVEQPAGQEATVDDPAGEVVGDEAAGDETAGDESAGEVVGDEAADAGAPEDEANQCIEATVTPTTEDSVDPADTTTFVNGGSAADDTVADAELPTTEPATDPAAQPATGEAAPTTEGSADPIGEATGGVTEPITEPAVPTVPAVPAAGGAPTQPDCVEAPPAEGHDDEQTELPVGGVDAGMGEAAGQNSALPIAGAAVAAAMLGLGAFRVVRWSLSKA